MVKFSHENALKAANNHTFSILQNNSSTLYGIFAFLKDLNGDYGSRYTIEANPRDGYEEECTPYYSEDNSFEIKFKFQTPFLLRGYAIANAAEPTIGNSYPKSWKIHGIDSTGKRILLDSQQNQYFCQDVLCKIDTILGYHVEGIRKGYTELTFQQTQNSINNPYVFLHSLDFFGTLCSSAIFCSFYQNTCKMKQFHFHPSYQIIFLLFSC